MVQLKFQDQQQIKLNQVQLKKALLKSKIFNLFFQPQLFLLIYPKNLEKIRKLTRIPLLLLQVEFHKIKMLYLSLEKKNDLLSVYIMLDIIAYFSYSVR
jgi:hypothetical protein